MPFFVVLRKRATASLRDLPHADALRREPQRDQRARGLRGVPFSSCCANALPHHCVICRTPTRCDANHKVISTPAVCGACFFRRAAQTRYGITA
ncbi:hypothetical protein [Burkholderia aenigmatica]|uniref:hypothetical protein n=1 Tax=Burkholderia aenigmatica TaxID=2015348 RepID=UPI001583FDE1|nr:hypothetical protein [Burkholderia aenigmatica]